MKVLCIGLVVLLLVFFANCSAWFFPVEKTVKNKDKWGGLKYPGVYELQQDVLLNYNKSLEIDVIRYGHGPEISYNVDDIKNMKVAPDYAKIIPKGTLLELTRMTYRNQVTHTQLNVFAKIISGEHRGKEVCISGFVKVACFTDDRKGIEGFDEKYIKSRE